LGFSRLAAHLTATILRLAPDCAHGAAPESVHQTRVAVRRLRSAFSLFGPAIPCPELASAGSGLRALGQVLGPARDWDVFLSGTGRDIAAALPEDPDLVRLLAAGRRRRAACYAALRAFLAGPEFRLLALNLAGLAAARPWEHHAAEEAPELAAFAAEALHRRRRKLLSAGDRPSELPDAALHVLRLHAKRLRYTAEFFAPLYPGKEARRFIRRVTELQEKLGLLNDMAVAAALVAELPRGVGRGAGGGLVRGFLAARAGEAREGIDELWRKLRKRDPFWN
ncbi:MAG TPA: CHAD domain-containing protein, partial [Acetobacteraceae bacterium]